MNPFGPAPTPLQRFITRKAKRFMGGGMDDRVGFESGEIRKQFFAEVRAALQSGSWEKFAESFGLSRNYFQNYQYGKLLMPDSLFGKMLSALSSERAEFFRGNSTSKPWNWGEIKGGEALYRKYPWEFKKRRENGLKKLKALGFGVAKEINSGQPLSKELCEFVGAFIGDGYLGGNDVVGISGHSTLDCNYHHYLAKKAEILFGISPCFYKSKVKKAIYTRFNSQNLVKMFNQRFGFPLGEKTYIVKIPREILSADEALLFRTVRGIFDTDGCVFFDKRKIYKKPYPRITLEIESQNLAEQLVQILGRHFSVRHKFGTKRGSCVVEIYGHAQLEKWMSIIGFSNERHLDRIKAGSGNCTRDLSIIVSPSLTKDTYQSTAPLTELSRQKLS